MKTKCHPSLQDRFLNRTVYSPLILLPVFLFALLLVDSVAAQAAIVTVDTTSDEWNSGGNCSIREALNAVRRGQNNRGCVGDTSSDDWGTNDTINVPAGLYTITRTGGYDNRRYFDLDVEAGVIINGAGGNDNGTRISGNAGSRVFQVISGVTATFNDLQVENGLSGDDFAGGGVDVANSGADLSLNRCAVVNCVGSGRAAGGLGVSGGGTLHLNSCLVTGNSNVNTAVGAGIDNDGGTVTATNSTISGNGGGGTWFF